jgi:amidohydrolase
LGSGKSDDRQVISPEKIKALATGYFKEVLEIRRHLHAHPELSFEENETAKYVAAVLDRHGIPYQSGVAGTGIVAHIAGKNPGKRTIALRGDMDALPIQEQNQCSYVSQHAGVMHACGHDVHTACVLGAAMILNALKSEWEGTVRLIFQPGEEKLPGGASLMIQEGVLENPRPDWIIGQHVFPELEVGKVGFRKGMYMASTDELFVTIKGKGGHAALPKQYNSPLLIASQLLLRLQASFMDASTREVPQGIPTVLAFGNIEGKGATNVIPEVVKLEGTFRTMDESWRKEAHARMKNIAAEIAKATQSEIHFDIHHGYPFLVNDENVTGTAIQAATHYLGKENVVELDVRMTAEDFAWYSQVIPACFYRLGTRNESKGITSAVHTPTFDVDEQSLETGMGLMAYLALQ